MATVRSNRAGLDFLLKSPGGAVSKTITRRGRRVESLAKKYAPRSEQPRRDGKPSGRLAASIRARTVKSSKGEAQAVIGPDLRIAPHARYVILGTVGPIVPRGQSRNAMPRNVHTPGRVFAGFLHGGRVRYRVQSVSGQPPQTFLQRALEEGGMGN